MSVHMLRNIVLPPSSRYINLIVPRFITTDGNAAFETLNVCSCDVLECSSSPESETYAHAYKNDAPVNGLGQFDNYKYISCTGNTLVQFQNAK